jgi:hypothetical protein
MPQYNDETKESVESVNQVVENMVTKDPVKKFEFISQMEGVLNKGNNGRMHFKPHLIFARRAAVKHLLKSKTYEEISQILGVSIDIVKRDVYLDNEIPHHPNP